MHFHCDRSPALCRLAAAQPGPAELATYSLGERGGLTVEVRVKREATFSDRDWLQIEVDNAGRAGTLESIVIKASAKGTGTFNSPNILESVVIGDEPAVPGPQALRTLPSGRYVTSELGTVAANHLGLRYPSIDVTIQLTIELALTDGRSFSMDTPQSMSFRWQPPSETQIAALRQQAAGLLNKALSTRLTNAETDTLRSLMSNDSVAEVLSLDVALALLKVHQLDETVSVPRVQSLVSEVEARPGGDCVLPRCARSTRPGSAV